MRRHLSYANVMATVAVFIALGGTSYAAIKVTGKNVKNGSLSGADVKNNSLTGSDVKSLGAGDFKKGTLRAGATGKTGPQGAAGATGAPGSALAYGRVAADGTLTLSKNVSVIKRGTSSYCIKVGTGTVQNISATFTGGSRSDSNLIASVGNDFPSCNAPHDAIITTFAGDGNANTLTAQPFFFVLN